MSRASAPILDSHTVLVTVLSIRVINALTVRTFFQPDEYYQALEPAWNFVPGHHGAWITWEWTQHLRSAIHPAMFSIVYYVADLIAHLTTRSDIRDGILIYAPKTVQAVVAALGDYYTWRLSDKVYGTSQLTFATLCLTVLSPWQWFCSTRSFSNGLESTLTVAALYYWPFDWCYRGSDSHPRFAKEAKRRRSGNLLGHEFSIPNLRTSLVLAATATIMRPTNLLIWIVLAINALFRTVQQPTKDVSKPKGISHSSNEDIVSRLLQLAREAVLCGGIVLILSAAVDRAFYGVWTFPALNFLYFNVVQSLAVFYGNNNWHYYLSEGYPLLLTTALPFAIVGLYRIFTDSASIRGLTTTSRQPLKQLAMICIVLPAALSILSHKEVRFIYPILGPLNVIAAAPVFDFFEAVCLATSQEPTEKSQNKVVKGMILVVLIFFNLMVAGYTTLVHNSGIIALPEYMRNEFTTHYTSPATNIYQDTGTQPQPITNMTLAILMPCHSLPWRSHLLNSPTLLVPGIQAWALTCEPPLHLTSPTLKKAYLDEADIFYANPALWLRKNMSRRPPRAFSGLNSDEKVLNIDPSAQQPRNPHLWTSISSSPDTSPQAQGLDITDLLPSLRTAPNQPPLTETRPETTLRRPWPHYLAFFAQLEPTMTKVLRGTGYTECWRVFNSHWHDDWRRTGDIVVWCLFPERARGGGAFDGNEGVAGEEQQRANDGEQGIDKGENGRDGNTVPQRPGKQRVIRPDL